MRRHARRFGKDGGIHIPRRPARLSRQTDGFAQQKLAVGVTEALIGRREVLADVTQRGRTEDGVGDGVEQHVGIRMSI